MPALIARLLPVLIIGALGYLLVRELDSIDRRREELKQSPVWSKIWPLIGWLVDFWVGLKRNKAFVFWVIRIVLIVTGLAVILSWMASN